MKRQWITTCLMGVALFYMGAAAAQQVKPTPPLTPTKDEGQPVDRRRTAGPRHL